MKPPRFVPAPKIDLPSLRYGAIVGHPAENARVPDIGRKSLDKISSFIP
jgi:hypothetical protein